MIHLHATQAVAFRVLIACDDVIERAIVTRCVELLGWVAVMADGLAGAPVQYAGRSRDVVVIDLAMDQSECLALLRSIRQAHGDPAVIFLTGAGDASQATAPREARALGLRIAGVMPRPIDPYRLHGLLLSHPERPVADQHPPPRYPSAQELREALRDGEIEADYQPRANLATGEIIGVEALARWRSPRWGAVPPENFVAVAEQSGLIGQLTARVLETAAAACGRLRTVRPDCTVAVKISPFLLAGPRFLSDIENLLGRNRLPPDALMLEISEVSLLANLPAATRTITRLGHAGVRMSITGFGNGHAALGWLRRMPLAELKLDRSLIAACATDGEVWKLIRGTISWARDFGWLAAADGIESEPDSDRLRDAGCDIGQGWYFGRPMHEAAILGWLTPVHSPAPMPDALLLSNLAPVANSQAPAH